MARPLLEIPSLCSDSPITHALLLPPSSTGTGVRDGGRVGSRNAAFPPWAAPNYSRPLLGLVCKWQHCPCWASSPLCPCTGGGSWVWAGEAGPGATQLWCWVKGSGSSPLCGRDFAVTAVFLPENSPIPQQPAPARMNNLSISSSCLPSTCPWAPSWMLCSCHFPTLPGHVSSPRADLSISGR